AVQQARFDAKEFALVRQEYLAQLESAQFEPAPVAQIASQRHLRPWTKGHALYVETHDESIEEVKAAKLEEAKQFYQEFYGASFAQMAVVGDFDAAKVKPLIADGLAGWKSPTPYVRIPIPYRDIAQ